MLTFRESMGLFWFDRYKALAEAALNLVLSILLVRQYQTLGVFIGTFLSTILTSVWVEPVSYTHLLFILYAEIIFLYYFNDLTGALLATLGFCLVTWAGSVLSAGGSDLWYGMGLVAGSFNGFTIAYFRLRFRCV